MKFDFLSLWELSLQPDIEDERLELLIPTKLGKVEHSLEDLSLDEHGKNLIMLMGVPGSGKSTMAEKLNKHCEGIGLSSKIISADDLTSDYIIKNLMKVDIDNDLGSIQVKSLEDAFNESADLYDVLILDGIFLSLSDRFVILKAVSEYFSNIVGLFLNTNLEELKRVQSQRFFKRISDEDFEYYQGLVKNLLQEKRVLGLGFDTVYIIQR